MGQNPQRAAGMSHSQIVSFLWGVGDLIRDTENVPLSERSVDAFFEREVKSHVPDAWIDTARRAGRGGSSLAQT